jgi:hypothetical protein
MSNAPPIEEFNPEKLIMENGTFKNISLEKNSEELTPPPGYTKEDFLPESEYRPAKIEPLSQSFAGTFFLASCHALFTT